MAAKFLNCFVNPAEGKINFESFIQFPLTIFRMVAFDLHPQNLKSTKKVLSYIKSFVTFSSLLVVVIAVIQLILYGFISSDSFAKTAGAAASSSSGFLIGVKAFITLTRKDDILKIFEELNEVFVTRANGITQHKVKKYLDGYLRIAKGFFFLTLFICLITFTVPFLTYVVFGAMQPSINYWFPFDPLRVGTFPIVLVWTDIATYFAATLMLGSDLLLYALITVISMEFDLLRIDFINLRLESSITLSKRFINLVDRHNKLLELSDMLQNIYAPAFLICFATKSVILCLTLFQLSTTSSELSVVVYLYSLLFVMGSQIFLLCYFGQKLITSSDGVVSGIYNCGWEDFDNINLKMHIILIIIRAQKPKKLTAMKLLDISLENFSTVSKKLNNITVIKHALLIIDI